MKDLDAGNEICAFLEKKIALLKQYLSITEKMRDPHRNNDDSSLEGLISKRHECINRIEKIDLSMGKIVKEGSYKLSRISNKFKVLIDNYLSNIRDILTTVEPLDRELMVMVKEEGESIKTELLKMQNVRQVTRGYKKEKRCTPRFLDTVR